MVADASGRVGPGNRGPAWLSAGAGKDPALGRLEARAGLSADPDAGSGSGGVAQSAAAPAAVTPAQRLGSSELTHGSMRWAMPWARLAMPVPLTTSAAPGTTLGMVAVGLPGSDIGKKDADKRKEKTGQRPQKDGRLIDCPGLGEDTPRAGLLRSLALG